MTELSDKRMCAKCGKDLTDIMGVIVFVNGKPVHDILLCVEHGANGSNGLTSSEYKTLQSTDKRRRTAPEVTRHEVGDTVRIKLPYSEVCMLMGMAGQECEVRVEEHMAQILNLDGTPFSLPITWGEAGIFRDSEGPYTTTVQPL